MTQFPVSTSTELVSPRLRAGLISIIALSLVLLVSLVWATRNTDNFAENYTLLLYLNLGIILVMTLVLGVLSRWIYVRWRKNVFGSRLLTRFTLSFVTLAIVPSLLLFLISTVFVSRTIDSWFQLKLDTALNSGIEFGRDRLNRQKDHSVQQLTLWAQNHSLQLRQASQREPLLTALMTEQKWQRIRILDATGNPIWERTAPLAGDSVSDNLPNLSPAQLTNIRQNWVEIEDEYQGFTEDETANAATAHPPRQFIHSISAIPNAQGTPTMWLYAQKVMPVEFSYRVNAIQDGLRDYQATAIARSGLRVLYRITLIVTLMVTILAALTAAFLIANRMIAPILWLAQATQHIAQGHYTLTAPRVRGADEMRQLVNDFGSMAQQLHSSRQQLTQNQHELESAKAYSEAVLDNLSSSVLVFSQNLHLLSYNQTTQRIFGIDFRPYLQQHLRDVKPLASLYDTIHEHIQRHHQHLNSQSSTKHTQSWRIQQTLEIPELHHQNEMTLSIQASCFLAEDDTYSWVLVCDDVSPIISAQRTLAWGEVAKRLAHEIKNPLTPIQLSAERLNVKLAEKLDETGQTQLAKATKTIINQVAALQAMVDEFRDYSRAPVSRFTDVQLNELIEEIGILYESGQDTSHRITYELAPDLPLLWADGQQLRQVLHNLIKNAIEAFEPRPDPTHTLAHIHLSTRLVQLTHNDTGHLLPNHAVKLSLIDNGKGFPEAVLTRMFEPYNSTKVHGTGLGLPIVKKIIDAHHAQIKVSNRTAPTPDGSVLGAQIDILFINLITTPQHPIEPKLL